MLNLASSIAAAAVPVLYACGSLSAARAPDPFRPALAAAAGACLAAAVGVSCWALDGTPTAGLLRFDAATAALLSLVTFLGLVIVRYSRSALHGDPGSGRYVRWLLATLAAVSVVASANHLGLVAAGWAVAGMCLHPLLTHFPERRGAVLAARKKFLVSRLGDVLLLAAVAVVAASAGTLHIDALAALPPSGWMEVAAVLWAGAAVMKSAQLPVHGWILQVMEAPTPVSALLHAGVVNLGGFTLIRLAPMMDLYPSAQTLLVVVGGATLTVASLVAMTRVSVKVQLAWSTCAQMGFLLMECGLGAYGLALLHLVGHSLYKAHAFLSAGSALERQVAARLAPEVPRAGAGEWALAAAVGLAAAALASAGAAEDRALVVLSAALAFAVPPLLVGRWTASAWAAVVGLVVAYAAAHALFGGPSHPDPLRSALALSALSAAFVVQVVVAVAPQGPVARWLYPRLFAGFSLDERLTLLTLRLWPLPRA